jgi:hypothetical protein
MSMKQRFLNKVYASIFGYFWIPCPLCGKEFGGQEWKSYDGKSDSIPSKKNIGAGEGICPDCTKSGKGIWQCQ